MSDERFTLNLPSNLGGTDVLPYEEAHQVLLQLLAKEEYRSPTDYGWEWRRPGYESGDTWNDVDNPAPTLREAVKRVANYLPLDPLPLADIVLLFMQCDAIVGLDWDWDDPDNKDSSY